jgi:hypothetical protein
VIAFVRSSKWAVLVWAVHRRDAPDLLASGWIPPLIIQIDGYPDPRGGHRAPAVPPGPRTREAAVHPLSGSGCPVRSHGQLLRSIFTSSRTWLAGRNSPPQTHTVIASHVDRECNISTSPALGAIRLYNTSERKWKYGESN